MSERAPEREPKIQPIFDDCSNCEKRYQLTGENTTGTIYPKQPECSYLMCNCPNCGYRTQIFVNETTMQVAALNNIEIEGDEMYAPDDVYKSWLEVKGIELPETYELTDRHEKLIRHFGEVVMNMPDDLLYDEITDNGHGTPHPVRWI